MIQVYLHEELIGRGLNVTMVDNFEHGLGHVVLRLHETGCQWEPYDPYDLVSPIEPTLRLPHDAGRALLDALVRHYQGAEDTRSLRRDYDAERKRVDEQTKVLADVVRALAGKAAQA